MSVEYKYSKEKGVVYVYPGDILTIEDVQDYTRRIEFDADIPNNIIEVVDFSRTEKIAITYREAWQLRSIFAQLIELKKLKGSVLIGPTDTHFGMARMFATVVEGVLDVQVVRNVKEAEEAVLKIRK